MAEAEHDTRETRAELLFAGLDEGKVRKFTWRASFTRTKYWPNGNWDNINFGDVYNQELDEKEDPAADG